METKVRTGNKAGLWESRYSNRLSSSLSLSFLSLCRRGCVLEEKGKDLFIHTHSIILDSSMEDGTHIHARESQRPLSLKINIKFSVLFF